ncbi:hypothetical protein BGZ76_010594 [Entomortierella beljakovae]|nr:hypothetical protein BGZ76_010594 [Entomortierella beljakovae]
MRTGFDSTFHPHLIDPVGNTIDSVVAQEHRLKTRLQNSRQHTPNVVAQTHLSSTGIIPSISHLDRKRLGSLIGASETTTAISSTSASSFIVTPKTEAANPISSLSLAFAAGQISSEKSLSIQGNNNNSNNRLRVNSGHLKSNSMAPQEGFTVSSSFFSKFKVKSWYQNAIQSKSQPIPKTRYAEGSSSSQEDGAISKRSNSDSTEVDSNASYSSPNTLSASTGDNLNSRRHIDVLDQLQNAGPHDPSNDSDGTVADLEELTTARRQRKYSFSSAYNSVGPDINSASCVPSSEPADASHAEVITELPSEDTKDISNCLPADNDDNERDPIELFEEILARQHMTEGAIAKSLHELRQLIIAYGIPEKPSIRGKCWKLLLEVHHVSAQEYISLVKRGKPEEYSKIRDDTFRTMPTDRKFTDVVGEERITRVLCAFAWSTQATNSQETGVSFTYVQGMNVLVAPFLYTMSEMEAFYSYSNLIKYCCPLYVQPTLQGVHCGIKLLEKCLSQIDNDLYSNLKSKRLTAELYAFPSVLTICACTPPLQEAMQLWDFLLAWGIHLNIICIIAQLHLIRDELMNHSSPMKLLRKFPDLNADKIIFHTMRMVKLLPDELYDQLVRHPYDPTVADQID